jgi:hypothetical protein
MTKTLYSNQDDDVDESRIDGWSDCFGAPRLPMALPRSAAMATAVGGRGAERRARKRRKRKRVIAMDDVDDDEEPVEDQVPIAIVRY